LAFDGLLHDLGPDDPLPEGASPLAGAGNLFLSALQPTDRPCWRGHALPVSPRGSTGRSCALAFGDAAALAAARGWAATAGFGHGTRVLCLATLNNGLAFNTSLLPVFLAGGTLAFHGGPLTPSAIIATVDAVDPTVLVAFPFLFELLTDHPRRLAAIRGRLHFAVSSAARLPLVTAATWQAATAAALVNYYGVAELGPVTFALPQAPGSVGRPIAGVRLRVVGEDGGGRPAKTVGRIAVSSPSRALGYLDAGGEPFEDALDAEGFVVTKDLGTLDREGNLFLRGRVGTILNIAGQKIDPREIEEVIAELPAVSAVVVRGEKGRQRTYLVAYVESREIGPEHVRCHCQERLPASRIPHEIHVRPHLPRSAAGKVMSASLNPPSEDRYGL